MNRKGQLLAFLILSFLVCCESESDSDALNPSAPSNLAEIKTLLETTGTTVDFISDVVGQYTYEVVNASTIIMSYVSTATSDDEDALTGFTTNTITYSFAVTYSPNNSNLVLTLSSGVLGENLDGNTITIKDRTTFVKSQTITMTFTDAITSSTSNPVTANATKYIGTMTTNLVFLGDTDGDPDTFKNVGGVFDLL